jgi:hypothetical protein
MPVFGQGLGRKLWLAFQLDQATIVPGQPVSFSIHITLAAKLDLGAVTASVYLVNDQGTQLSPTPLWSATLPKNDVAAFQPRQTYEITPGLIPTPAPLQAPNLMYTKGAQYFGCVLSGTGADGGPYQAYDWVQVVLETIDPEAWWQWTNPSPQVYVTYQWKNQDYTVNGLFKNAFIDLPLKVPTTLKSVTLSVVEEEIGAGGLGNVIATREYATTPDSLSNFNQGADNEVLYSVKPKNWPWHLQGTYAITDDLERVYMYRLHLTNISDQYNNQYSDQLFAGINVHVAVDQVKIAASITALSAFGVWVSASGAFAFADIVGKLIFGAIASAAASVLGLAGKIADDPPGPDPRYRQEVRVLPPPLPPLLAADPELRPIGTFFEAATRIVATVDALNMVANRLSIAQRQRDTRAVRLHTASRRTMLAQMIRDWDELNNALQPALAALAGLQSSRVTKSIDPKVLQYELPQEAQDALAAALGTPLTVAAFADPKDALRRLADAVSQLVAKKGEAASKTMVIPKRRPRN